MRKRVYGLSRRQVDRMQRSITAFERSPRDADLIDMASGKRPALVPVKVTTAIPKMDWSGDSGTANSGPGAGWLISVTDIDLARFGLVPGGTFRLWNLYPDAVPIGSIAWCTHFAGELFVVAASCTGTPPVPTPPPSSPSPSPPPSPTTTFATFASEPLGWPSSSASTFGLGSSNTSMGLAAGSGSPTATAITPPPPP